MRKKHWSREEIRELSTDKIIEKLHDFGIPITPEKFLEDVHSAYGGLDIAKRWRKDYTITAEHLDLDFPRMAAIVLWERLAPDVMSNEKLDDLINQGYDLLEYNHNEAKACLIWLEVWEHLKQRVEPDVKSIEVVAQHFNDTFEFYNWCQDLELYLGDIALENSQYYYPRITYCREFCQRFPETEEEILVNMKRAEAESHFFLGNIEAGEKLFQELVNQFPHSAWGYVGWGDMYCFKVKNAPLPLDYSKAEKIYKSALKNNVDEPKVIRDRLRSLAKKTGGKGFGRSNS